MPGATSSGIWADPPKKSQNTDHVVGVFSYLFRKQNGRMWERFCLVRE